MGAAIKTIGQDTASSHPRVKRFAQRMLWAATRARDTAEAGEDSQSYEPTRRKSSEMAFQEQGDRKDHRYSRET